jgi:hypothetical protein
MKNTRPVRPIERHGVAASKRALRPPAVLNLSIQYGVAKRGLPSQQRIRSWARGALLADMRVTFRLVGAREGRMLNRDFRGRIMQPTF